MKTVEELHQEVQKNQKTIDSLKSELTKEKLEKIILKHQ